MNKFRDIFALLLLLLAVGCTEYSDDIEDERESIVSFLTSTHSPNLIAESEVAESLDINPEFYTSTGYTAYRYIADYYSESRELLPQLVDGDKITITFWCYDFSTYTTPSSSYLYFTNDVSYQEALEEAGLDTQYWSFEPKQITLGAGDILSGIDRSLVGCKEGDYVEIYLTSNLAYSNSWIGVTALDMPMAFICTIDSVEN